MLTCGVWAQGQECTLSVHSCPQPLSDQINIGHGQGRMQRPPCHLRRPSFSQYYRSQYFIAPISSFGHPRLPGIQDGCSSTVCHHRGSPCGCSLATVWPGGRIHVRRIAPILHLEVVGMDLKAAEARLAGSVHVVCESQGLNAPHLQILEWGLGKCSTRLPGATT